MTENKKETVMVVEDCEADIDALVECLGGEYRVRVATNGDHALEDIRANPPSMVLLDVLMPGIDGFEVCRRIKEDSSIRDTLIIFVTGLSDAIDETKGLELGAIDYITKPFNFSVIRAKIRTHLELARARRELKRQNELLRENIALREQVDLITRHDLKNPIQIILGSAQLLEMMPTMERSKMDSIVKKQIHACYSIMDMINRTMDLYKMEENIYVPDIKKMDILPLLDRMIHGIECFTVPKNITVSIDLNGCRVKPDDSFPIPCDELLFSSMIGNLLKNAVEASPSGEAVGISLSGDREVMIEITNRGAVCPEIRDTFFDKFVTGDKHRGTGIGTYSARMMARVHGGDMVFFTSDSEDRTTLTINLPGSLKG